MQHRSQLSQMKKSIGFGRIFVLWATMALFAACLVEPFFIAENGMTEPKARTLLSRAADGLASGIEMYWLSNKSNVLALDEAEFSLLSGDLFTNDEPFVPWPLSTNDEELAGMYDCH